MSQLVVDFKDLMQRYSLEFAIDSMTCLNSSAFAPYHGAYHEAVVLVEAHKIGQRDHLSNTSMRELLLAAAFHDHNHSMGLEVDSVNISRAVDFVQQMLEYQSRYVIAARTINIDNVTTLIRATQYPYVDLNYPLDLQESVDILRDADLMMPYLPDDQAIAMFTGLKQEMEASGANKRTWLDFAEGVRKFYSNVSWHTSFGAERAKAQMPSRLEAIYTMMLNLDQHQ
jgi:hypothetical protein